VRVDAKKYKVYFFDNANGTNRIKLDPVRGKFIYDDLECLNGKEKVIIHCRNKPAIEWSDGMQEWIQEGVHHRKDGPAITYAGNNEEGRYFINGIELSKEQFDMALEEGIEPIDDGEKFAWVLESTSIPHYPERYGDVPAVVWGDGTKEWYSDGLLSRDPDLGPAKIDANGSYAYILDGKLNRLDGPATENINGSQGWFVYGGLHRKCEDGPAVTHADGGIEYWENGQKHNLYGPAIIYPDGEEEYWLYGHKHCKSEWKENVEEHLRHIKESAMRKVELSLKSALNSYIGSKKDQELLNEQIKPIIQNVLNDLEKININNKEKPTVPADTSHEQLELNLNTTNEKLEKSNILTDDGPSWKMTIGALLMAAGVKGLTSISSNNAVHEAFNFEQEFECQ